MAAMVTQLFDHYGIALLGFDVVFAEPDNSSGLSSLEAIAGGQLKGDAGFHSPLTGLRGTLNFDRRFAEALRNRPLVLGYYFTNIDQANRSGASVSYTHLDVYKRQQRHHSRRVSRRVFKLLCVRM